jgi:predicted metal-binding transcription factor (methanogenesis marker protein 9)
MSSNSDYAQGLVIINGRAYPVKEVLQALERQAMTSVRAVGDELWIGKERVRSLAKTTPEQAMKLTCYGSLAFCCDLTRECHLRDQALELLSISKEEYRAIQRECHQQFLRQGERQWPQEQYSSSSSDNSRSHSKSEDQTQHESFDSWLERSSPGRYGTSREPTQSSNARSGSSVDLGGLFSTLEEYSSRSLTDPDPNAGISSRGIGETSSFSSEDGYSSGGSAAASPRSTAPGFCVYCGQDLREDSEFCSRCGRNQK